MALIAVQGSGYSVVRSSAPVVAAALVTSAAGGVAGYAAVGVAATGSGSGGTRPTPSATAVGVLNAASFKGGAVAPGEIVTIFGANMGPAGLATLRLEAGRVATELEGARVLFDGVAAPVIYTLAGQGSVIVPYSLAGKASTQMVVEYQGRRSDPVTLPVTASAPGLFSVNSSRHGARGNCKSERHAEFGAESGACGKHCRSLRHGRRRCDAVRCGWHGEQRGVSETGVACDSDRCRAKREHSVCRGGAESGGWGFQRTNIGDSRGADGGESAGGGERGRC